mmetsp:Transcript_70908/g.217317  ORF Transcript_70908/g.217317 Transcript_70908/m.217317 type:complete len:313 (-) Transcript_70908:993-1931(-)
MLPLPLHQHGDGRPVHPEPASVILELQVAEPDRIQGVVPDGLHLADHPLDRQQDQLVYVPAEEQRADREHDDDEDRLHHTQDGLPLDETAHVEHEHELALHVLFEEGRLMHDRGKPNGLLLAQRGPRAGHAAQQRDAVDHRVGLAAVVSPGLRQRALDVLRHPSNDVSHGVVAGQRVPLLTCAKHLDVALVSHIDRRAQSVTALLLDIADPAKLVQPRLQAGAIAAVRALVVVKNVCQYLHLPIDALPPQQFAGRAVRQRGDLVVSPRLENHISTILRRVCHHGDVVARMQRRNPNQHCEDKHDQTLRGPLR